MLSSKKTTKPLAGDIPPMPAPRRRARPAPDPTSEFPALAPVDIALTWDGRNRMISFHLLTLHEEIDLLTDIDTHEESVRNIEEGVGRLARSLVAMDGRAVPGTGPDPTEIIPLTEGARLLAVAETLLRAQARRGRLVAEKR